MKVHGAFAASGCTGGEGDDGDIVGGGIAIVESRRLALHQRFKRSAFISAGVEAYDSCFGTSHQALGTYSDGLHTMAKHYQDAEENSATLFKAE